MTDQYWNQSLYEPMEKLKIQRKGERKKKGKRAESKRNNTFNTGNGNCCIRGICCSDICYGNPPFAWNLLRDSRWIVFVLFTWLHNLRRLDWMTKDAAHTIDRMQHTHTLYLQPEGKKKASCLQFLDIASHKNCSPTSPISTQVTTHSSISSVWFLQINITFPSSRNIEITLRKLYKMIMSWINNFTVNLYFQ